MNKYLAAGLVSVTVGGVGTLIAMGYQYAFKKGRKIGAVEREKEIMNDCTLYVPLGQIDEFAEDMMEIGMNEYSPLLVIRADKYDYLSETDPEDPAGKKGKQ